MRKSILKGVNTLVQIQEAISELQPMERKALYVWMQSQGELSVGSEEEGKLLASLDEAIRELESGKGVGINEARKLVSSWAGR